MASFKGASMSIRRLAALAAIFVFLTGTLVLLSLGNAEAQRTAKPVLHGRHWMAITGKPAQVIDDQELHTTSVLSTETQKAL